MLNFTRKLYKIDYVSPVIHLKYTKDVVKKLVYGIYHLYSSIDWNHLFFKACLNSEGKIDITTGNTTPSHNVLEFFSRCYASRANVDVGTFMVWLKLVEKTPWYERTVGHCTTEMKINRQCWIDSVDEDDVPNNITDIYIGKPKVI